MNQTLIASFSFTLLIAIALLVREVKFRRSLQKLLHRLLSYWRPDAHDPTPSSPRRDDPADRSGDRL
jgi:hypothetical protein